MKVTLERSGAIATVTFSNPPSHTLTDPMVRQLEGITGELARTTGLRVVVFRGAGEDVFIAHYEVGELADSADAQQAALRDADAQQAALRDADAQQAALRDADAQQAAAHESRRELHRFHRVLLAFERLDAVTVAAINGTAMGGGCELTLACDFRLLREGPYRYGLPETSVGIIPGAGGTQRLARLIGLGRALDLILHARVLGPAEALSLGMVHRVLSADRFYEEVDAFAKDLAARAPIALAAAKRAIRGGLEGDLESGLHLEQDMFERTMRSTDAAGAMRAALAGKPFEFSGR